VNVAWTGHGSGGRSRTRARSPTSCGPTRILLTWYADRRTGGTGRRATVAARARLGSAVGCILHFWLHRSARAKVGTAWARPWRRATAARAVVPLGYLLRVLTRDKSAMHEGVPWGVTAMHRQTNGACLGFLFSPHCIFSARRATALSAKVHNIRPSHTLKGGWAGRGSISRSVASATRSAPMEL
jgi:hypothetical protein